MKKKIVWLVVSCLMVLSLVLASCGAAEVEEEEVVVPPEEEEVVPPEEEVIVPPEEEEVVEEEVAPAPEKPKYGGVLTLGVATSPRFFDDCKGVAPTTLTLTNEDLLGGDWTKGPIGTGETTFMYATFLPTYFMKPLLAESWEHPDPDTMVFHIRKGVNYHDKPPANGRDVTVDDVVYSLNRLWDAARCPGSVANLAYGRENWVESITATDEWTVLVKSKPGKEMLFELVADWTKIFPREAIELHGDMNDPANIIGTGPFIMDKYITDSAWTVVRNPDYWDKQHPLYPEDAMPYLDGVKGIIIPDMSTRMAALRTAKIDVLSSVNWEDAKTFKEENPEINYVRVLGSPVTLAGRIDKPELPFHDKRVRDALALAINNQEILDTYYGGEAELFVWPGAPIPGFKETFIPLEELPESVQELYGYNPEKARQLLADAGYPEGFKTEILTTATSVDILSVVKAYWADIGVDLKLDVKEGAVKAVVGWKRSYKEMNVAGLAGYTPFALGEIKTKHLVNYAMVSDERVDKLYDDLNTVYFDYPAKVELLREVIPYIAEQNWFPILPAPYTYTFWQPWIKDYHGELYVGFVDSDYPRWIWIDQDLKEEMTGRR